MPRPPLVCSQKYIVIIPVDEEEEEEEEDNLTFYSAMLGMKNTTIPTFLLLFIGKSLILGRLGIGMERPTYSLHFYPWKHTQSDWSDLRSEISSGGSSLPLALPVYSTQPEIKHQPRNAFKRLNC